MQPNKGEYFHFINGNNEPTRMRALISRVIGHSGKYFKIIGPYSQIFYIEWDGEKWIQVKHDRIIKATR